ncbi:MAG: TVP38/TMEM64 family protein [Gemmataceae bacterium]|nr:TVP38/TMEM64 family protein [Gemmataceae bacterium]
MHERTHDQRADAGQSPGRVAPSIKRWVRVLVPMGIVAVIVAFYALGYEEELSWESLQRHRSDLRGYVQDQPVASVLVYYAGYLIVTTLSLPITPALGLLAGAVFGRWWGTLLVSFASTSGASIAFSLSRYLFRDWIETRWGAQLKPVQRGVEREGAYYLLTLRLSPIVPFTWINIALGLTRMRLWTFWWVSQLGMLPVTFIFVNVGASLGDLEKPGDILSPALLISLTLAAFVPLALRKLWTTWRGVR